MIALVVVVVVAAAGFGLATRWSAPTKDDFKRAVAAAFPECDAWEDSPVGTEFAPGVTPEWAFGCGSVAGVLAFPSDHDICDYWTRLGDGPDRIAVSRSSAVIAFDLSGTDSYRMNLLADSSPDLFEVTTPSIYCGVVSTTDPSTTAASPAATGTPTATSAAVAETAGDYMVGDTGPGGGIVFYDAGSVQPWGQYLEAGPELAEEDWCDDWKLDVAGTYKTIIGAGAANTKLIAAACGAGAANTVSDYDVGGKTDWFLPSKDELNVLYEQRDSVGGFASGYYWSSSQNGAGGAWTQGFDDGNQYYGSKDYSDGVRPVRAF